LFTHADVLTGLAGVGNQQLKRAQFHDKLVLVSASPPIAADVVIALATSTSPVKTADVREAFADAGWDTRDLGPLSALPTADVMIALQDLWKGLR
jgi:ABC-type phosphate/phosphonate transport system substrate-binding protein